MAVSGKFYETLKNCINKYLEEMNIDSALTGCKPLTPILEDETHDELASKEQAISDEFREIWKKMHSILKSNWESLVTKNENDKITQLISKSTIILKKNSLSVLKYENAKLYLSLTSWNVEDALAKVINTIEEQNKIKSVIQHLEPIVKEMNPDRELSASEVQEYLTESKWNIDNAIKITKLILLSEPIVKKINPDAILSEKSARIYLEKNNWGVNDALVKIIKEVAKKKAGAGLEEGETEENKITEVNSISKPILHINKFKPLVRESARVALANNEWNLYGALVEIIQSLKRYNAPEQGEPGMGRGGGRLKRNRKNQKKTKNKFKKNKSHKCKSQKRKFNKTRIF